MYIGRCACKKWIWKKVNDSLFHSDFSDQKVGTIRAIIKTSNPKGFTKEEKAMLKESRYIAKGGLNFSEIALEVKGLSSKEDDISNYNSLKSQIEKINSADYAVICVKKNPKTWSSTYCGKR